MIVAEQGSERQCQNINFFRLFARAEERIPEGLANESYLFQRLLRTESGPRSMRRFLEIGGQTRDGELRVGSLNGEV